MRILLAFLLSCLPLAAQTVNVTYVWTDFGLSPQSVRRVDLKPLQPFADYGGAILTANPMSQVTGTNGSVTFSNVISGYSYTVTLSTPYGTLTRTNGFPTGLSGNVNGRDYLGVFVNPQVFAFFYLNTNLNPLIPAVAAGSGVAITTNGLVYLISSFGGSGVTNNQVLTGNPSAQNLVVAGEAGTTPGLVINNGGYIAGNQFGHATNTLTLAPTINDDNALSVVAPGSGSQVLSVDLSGNMVATSFTGNGAGLTNVLSVPFLQPTLGSGTNLSFPTQIIGQWPRSIPGTFLGRGCLVRHTMQVNGWALLTNISVTGASTYPWYVGNEPSVIPAVKPTILIDYLNETSYDNLPGQPNYWSYQWSMFGNVTNGYLRFVEATQGDGHAIIATYKTNNAFFDCEVYAHCEPLLVNPGSTCYASNCIFEMDIATSLSPAVADLGGTNGIFTNCFFGAFQAAGNSAAPEYTVVLLEGGATNRVNHSVFAVSGMANCQQIVLVLDKGATGFTNCTFNLGQGVSGTEDPDNYVFNTIVTIPDFISGAGLLVFSDCTFNLTAYGQQMSKFLVQLGDYNISFINCTINPATNGVCAINDGFNVNWKQGAGNIIKSNFSDQGHVTTLP